MRTRRSGIVITVANQKGGVGKSTNAVHLAAALGLGGHRCLIIDLDPAAGATRHLGVDANSYAGSLELLTGVDALDRLTIQDDLPPGVHLVPSRPQLCELETRLSRFVDRTQLLQAPLTQARLAYEFIFLDTAPVAGATTTVAAYSTADWILLSAFPHPLSLAGLTEAFNDIADVRRYRNPALEVLGVVFTNVDRRATRLRAEMESVIAAVLPNRLFETQIAQSVAIPDASGRGQTLFQAAGYTRLVAAQQYLRLAAEIEHRIRHRDALLRGALPPLVEAVVATPRPADVSPEA